MDTFHTYICSFLNQAATNIPAKKFEDNLDLVSYTVSDGITQIGSSAFKACKNLKEVIIPDSVTKIGEYTFYDCKSLTSIIIPNGVTEISTGAFSKCTSLKYITIPDGVTEIGEKVFYGCQRLRFITIPDSVTHIDRRPFMFCGDIELILPDNYNLPIHEADLRNVNGYQRKITRHSDVHKYVIGDLKLQGSYSIQQKCIIYELLNTDKLTAKQFRNLTSIIKTIDVNKIIPRLQDRTIPDNVIKLHDAIIALPDKWSKITDNLTVSEYARISMASKNTPWGGWECSTPSSHRPD